MNWLTNFIRPKIQSIVQQKDVPENLWQKCPSCDGMLFHRDLAENLNVCSHCDHHMKLGAKQRLDMLFDDGNYKLLPVPKVPHDPLKFKDKKKYSDRLRDARAKTGRDDAIMSAVGTIGGIKVVIAALDFSFMGGSMGAAMGEGIVAAAQTAVKEKAAFVVIPTSGGARMQEGMISLMQMPRSIIAAEMVKNEGLPYIVILTDPTTGGVSASFAMVGDIHMAEPGCMIGFAGKRVIQETIREELPENFQTAEYLLEHGMIDMVTPRGEMRDTLARILDLLLNQKKKYSSKGDADPKKKGGKGISGRKTTSAEKNVRASAQVSSDVVQSSKIVPLPKSQKNIGANDDKKADTKKAASK